jgi:hypothetical protein
VNLHWGKAYDSPWGKICYSYWTATGFNCTQMFDASPEDGWMSMPTSGTWVDDGNFKFVMTNRAPQGLFIY